MANIKQQKKRVGIAARQRLENLRYKSASKTLLRALQDNVNAGDKEAAAASHKELVRLLDRAGSRKAMHKNTVARKKARAARVLIAEPVKESKVIRKTKKKAPARKPAAEKPAKKSDAGEDAPAPKAKAPAKAKATPAKAKAAKAEAPAPEAVEETPAEATAEEAPAAEATEESAE